jgi:hypothetical protein
MFRSSYSRQKKWKTHSEIFVQGQKWNFGGKKSGGREKFNVEQVGSCIYVSSSLFLVVVM